MGIGDNLGESFEYAKEALVGKWVRWILLIIISIIPIVNFIANGYIVRVLRGIKPAPELEDYGQLFIDGLLYSVIMFIWMIPVFIVTVIFFGGISTKAIMSGSDGLSMAGLGGMFIGSLVLFIVAILCGLFAYIGVVRFARMEKFGEAFAFAAIKDKIGEIGWVNYIIALIVVNIAVIIIAIIIATIIAIIIGILAFIPVLGWILGILGLILGLIVLLASIPFLNIFMFRYICNLYDSA